MPSISSVGNAGAVLLVAAVATITTGPLMLDAKRMTKWNWYLSGTFTGFSVTIQGTIDPFTAGFIGASSTQTPAPAPNANWFNIPAEAVQGGTGIEANPLTNNTMSLSYDRPLMAVRAVVVGT